MANDKNKINELVIDDDDPTAELEMLADTFGFAESRSDDSGASLTELKSDLKTRSETIHRLQYDIEQLRAKWTGLETEIKAREELSNNLNTELNNSTEMLAHKEKLLKKRDQSIESLQAEIRDHND